MNVVKNIGNGSTNYDIVFANSTANVTLKFLFGYDHMKFFKEYISDVLHLTYITHFDFNLIHCKNAILKAFTVDGASLLLNYHVDDKVAMAKLDFTSEYFLLEYLRQITDHTYIHCIKAASIEDVQRKSYEIKSFKRIGNDLRLEYTDDTTGLIKFKLPHYLESYIYFHYDKIVINTTYSEGFRRFALDYDNTFDELDYYMVAKEVNSIKYTLKSGDSILVKYKDLDLYKSKIVSLASVYKDKCAFDLLVKSLESTTQSKLELDEASEWVKTNFKQEETTLKIIATDYNGALMIYKLENYLLGNNLNSFQNFAQSFIPTNTGGIVTLNSGYQLEFVEEDSEKALQYKIKILCDLLETKLQPKCNDIEVFDVLYAMYKGVTVSKCWEVEDGNIVFDNLKLIPTYGQSSLDKLVDKLHISCYKGIDILSSETQCHSNDFTPKTSVILEHLTGNAKSSVKIVHENMLCITIINKGSGDSKAYAVEYKDSNLYQKVYDYSNSFRILQSDVNGILPAQRKSYIKLTEYFKGNVKPVKVTKIDGYTLEFSIFNSNAHICERHQVRYVDFNLMKQVIELNYPKTNFANLAKAYKAGVIDFIEFEEKVNALNKPKSHKTITIKSTMLDTNSLLDFFKIKLGEAICSDDETITYQFESDYVKEYGHYEMSHLGLVKSNLPKYTSTQT